MSTLNKEKIINQHGVVSIVVSVIIMIVLTLIAVAFAQIMRREQRQALDRQLSSQAYYAAESAINDAAYALSQDPDSLNAVTEECIDTPTGALSQPEVSEDLRLEYSCVTIDSRPGELRYDAIPVSRTTQFEIRPIDINGDSAQLQSLNIQWREQLGNLNLPGQITTGVLDLPQVLAAQRPGILRVEIIPMENTKNQKINRDALIAKRKVFFMYPVNDSNGSPTSEVDWSTSPSGTIVQGECASSLDQKCSVVINDIESSSASMTYIVRLRSIYRNVEAAINGKLVNDQEAKFKGAQVQIDATGRANDVLRRISARVAVEQSSSIPDHVLQAYDGVCKKIELVDENNVDNMCYRP